MSALSGNVLLSCLRGNFLLIGSKKGWPGTSGKDPKLDAVYKTSIFTCFQQADKCLWLLPRKRVLSLLVILITGEGRGICHKWGGDLFSLLLLPLVYKGSLKNFPQGKNGQWSYSLR